MYTFYNKIDTFEQFCVRFNMGEMVEFSSFFVSCSWLDNLYFLIVFELWNNRFLKIFSPEFLSGKIDVQLKLMTHIYSI